MDLISTLLICYVLYRLILVYPKRPNPSHYDYLTCLPPLSLKNRDLGSTRELLYLDLMKRALLNFLYEDKSLWSYSDMIEIEEKKEDHVSDKELFLNKEKKVEILLGKDSFCLAQRYHGEDVPRRAMTKMGWIQLTTVQKLAKYILNNHIEGDFVDVGAFRGGCSLFLKSILRARNNTTKTMYVVNNMGTPPYMPEFCRMILFPFLSLLVQIEIPEFQSLVVRLFEGLAPEFSNHPRPVNHARTAEFAWRVWKTENFDRYWDFLDNQSLSSIKRTFSRFGLLDSDTLVRFLDFQELKKEKFQKISFLKISCESYQSVRSSLQLLEPYVVSGGCIYLDDMKLVPEAGRALKDHFDSIQKPVPNLTEVDTIGAYWKK